MSSPSKGIKVPRIWHHNQLFRSPPSILIQRPRLPHPVQIQIQSTMAQRYCCFSHNHDMSKKYTQTQQEPPCITHKQAPLDIYYLQPRVYNTNPPGRNPPMTPTYIQQTPPTRLRYTTPNPDPYQVPDLTQ